MPKRIDTLTEGQRARMPEWRDKWIAMGLKTGETDWARFERGIRSAYEAANLSQPKRVIRCSSPLVAVMAGPIASSLIRNRGAVRGAVHGAVGEAVDEAVRGAVGEAVHGAVDEAVHGAVDEAVRGAVGEAVHEAVDEAVHGAVGEAVRGAVDEAVHGAVGEAVHGAVKEIRMRWYYYLGGQFWVGGWWGSPAFVSFFREVCGLELSADIAKRADAYEDICSSASWCWPHTDFVMVSARPKHIHRDEQGRLHSLTTSAIEWPDGFGIYSVHGVRVQGDLIVNPKSITVDRIEKETNAEIRRVMIELYGQDRYIIDSGAEELHRDSSGILYRKTIPNDEPLVMLKVLNSTHEPDGDLSREDALKTFPSETPVFHDDMMIQLSQAPESYRFKSYFIRVDPQCRPIIRIDSDPGGRKLGEPQKLTAHNAVASTFGLYGYKYSPCFQT